VLLQDGGQKGVAFAVCGGQPGEGIALVAALLPCGRPFRPNVVSVILAEVYRCDVVALPLGCPSSFFTVLPRPTACQ
jgi:hypothetical protein